MRKQVLLICFPSELDMPVSQQAAQLFLMPVPAVAVVGDQSTWVGELVHLRPGATQHTVCEVCGQADVGQG
jgi:hypothetical protein